MLLGLVGTLAVLSVIWFTIPIIYPAICKNYSPICEIAIRGCSVPRDVPPISQMHRRFPEGYKTAIRICRWPIYSKETKIIALNALAWYAYLGIERERCLAELNIMATKDDYRAHCSWLIPLCTIDK